MPLVPFARILFSWLGILALALAGYLVWSWCAADIAVDAAGRPVRDREDWRLWTAGALVIWSLLGRVPMLLLLARPDTEKTEPYRSQGEMIVSPTTARIYLESEGGEEGPVVIATHGWGLDSTIWQYLRRSLGSERALIPHKIVVWDLPGLGRSAAPSDGVISIPRYAADLAELIQTQSPRPVVLIGHSIGGMIIQTLARDRPDIVSQRVSGIILFNTTYTNPLETMIGSRLALALRKPVIEPVLRLAIWLKWLAWAGAWQGYLNGTAHAANRLQFGRSVTRSQLEHTTLLGTRNPPDSLAKGNLAMFNWSAEGAMADVACPVHIVSGQMDLVTLCEAGRDLARQNTAAVFTQVSDVNHMGFIERAHRYNTLSTAFVADVATLGSSVKQPPV